MFVIHDYLSCALLTKNTLAVVTSDLIARSRIIPRTSSATPDSAHPSSRHGLFTGFCGTFLPDPDLRFTMILFTLLLGPYCSACDSSQ